MNLPIITAFLDQYLRIREIGDWPGAMNGLQLENGGTVTKIGAAVDSTLPVIEEAISENVDLLLVHHGLFWSGAKPITRANYRKLKLALDHNVAVYSAHLPLDLHPECGNNAVLARELGFGDKTEPFFFEKGQLIGLRIGTKISRVELLARLKSLLGSTPHMAPGGPEIVHEIGIVTGGAGAEIARAAAEGIDTFITGEGPHWSHGAAEELGVNLIYGGHYATETFGVKALASRIYEEFSIPWTFIDHPTGL